MRVHGVAGPIETADLGFTLMHEHLFVRWDGIEQNYPHLWPRPAVIRRAVEQVRGLQRRGVTTLVDVTVVGGLGRDLPAMREVVRRTGFQVLAATGCYTSIPIPFERGEIDETAALFVRDVEEGIAGTDVRAAIIKCATGEDGVTAANEKVLRACARAHRETGVPIITHSVVATGNGLDQLDVFEEEGVEPGRVIIGHLGDSDDIAFIERVIARGACVGLDRFGIDDFLPLERRIETVVRLCERGYAGRLMLSQDYASTLWRWRDEPADARRPRWGYTLIPEVVIPALLERGVTRGQIDTMVVDNPRRIFEQAGPY